MMSFNNTTTPVWMVVLLSLTAVGMNTVPVSAVFWAYNSSTDALLSITSVSASGAVSVGIASIAGSATTYTTANPTGVSGSFGAIDAVSVDSGNSSCITYNGVVACQGSTITIVPMVSAVIELACSSADSLSMHLRWRVSLTNATQSVMVISPSAAYWGAPQFNSSDMLGTLADLHALNTCPDMTTLGTSPPTPATVAPVNFTYPLTTSLAAWGFNLSTDIKLTIVSSPGTGTSTVALGVEIINGIATSYTPENPSGIAYVTPDIYNTVYDPDTPDCVTYNGLMACEGATVEVTTFVYAQIEKACSSSDGSMMHLRWRYSVADTIQSFIVIRPTAAYWGAPQYNASDILATLAAFHQLDTCPDMTTLGTSPPSPPTTEAPTSTSDATTPSPTTETEGPTPAPTPTAINATTAAPLPSQAFKPVYSAWPVVLALVMSVVLL